MKFSQKNICCAAMDEDLGISRCMGALLPRFTAPEAPWYPTAYQRFSLHEAIHTLPRCQNAYAPREAKVRPQLSGLPII